MNEIQSFESYKTYLKSELDRRPRGERSRLAESMRCHTAYLSFVLNGDSDLSLEQAQSAAQHLGLTDSDTHVFILMVELARASTPALKRYFQKQLEQIRTDRKQLKNREDFKKSLSREDQTIYYSAWYYSAIHILLAIPGHRTPQTIADYLGLKKRLVNDVLDFLVSKDLAIREAGEFKIGKSGIHLPYDSPMISKHHLNWRLQAMQSLERGNEDDLHYSSVVSLSATAYQSIRKILIDAVEDARAEIREAKDQKLAFYAIDLVDLEKQMDR